MSHASLIKKHSNALPLSAVLTTLLLAAGSSPAFAENPDLDTGSVSTCNVKGTVTVTLLGNTVAYPLTCVNETKRSERGIDEKSIIKDVDLSLPVLEDAVNLRLVQGESEYTTAPFTTTRRGRTEGAAFDALQGLIAMDAVAGGLECTDSSVTRQVDCKAFTTVGAMLLNGKPVDLPTNIPLNFTLPLVNGPVDIQLPLLGRVVSVPLNGKVVLNEVVVSGDGTEPTIEHNPVHASLSGTVDVLGAGLVKVNVDIIDHTTWTSKYGTPYNVTPVVMDDCPGCQRLAPAL